MARLNSKGLSQEETKALAAWVRANRNGYEPFSQAEDDDTPIIHYVPATLKAMQRATDLYVQ